MEKTGHVKSIICIIVTLILACTSFYFLVFYNDSEENVVYANSVSMMQSTYTIKQGEYLIIEDDDFCINPNNYSLSFELACYDSNVNIYNNYITSNVEGTYTIYIKVKTSSKQYTKDNFELNVETADKTDDETSGDSVFCFKTHLLTMDVNEAINLEDIIITELDLNDISFVANDEIVKIVDYTIVAIDSGLSSINAVYYYKGVLCMETLKIEVNEVESVNTSTIYLTESLDNHMFILNYETLGVYLDNAKISIDGESVRIVEYDINTLYLKKIKTGISNVIIETENLITILVIEIC